MVATMLLTGWMPGDVPNVKAPCGPRVLTGSDGVASERDISDPEVERETREASTERPFVEGFAQFLEMARTTSPVSEELMAGDPRQVVLHGRGVDMPRIASQVDGETTAGAQRERPSALDVPQSGANGGAMHLTTDAEGALQKSDGFALSPLMYAIASADQRDSARKPALPPDPEPTRGASAEVGNGTADVGDADAQRAGPAEGRAAGSVSTTLATASPEIQGTRRNGRDGNATGTVNESRGAASAPVAATTADMPALLATPSATGTRAAAPVSVASWGPQLVTSLGHRVSVQMGSGVEQTVIRLDPASMGALQIAVRHQGGALQVHLMASNEEVARQLQAAGDAMRQELAQKHQGEVSVVVRHDSAFGQAGQAGHGARREARENDKRPGRALAEVSSEDDGMWFRLDNVLVG
jgi:flagellar hook-length control protein FliK